MLLDRFSELARERDEPAWLSVFSGDGIRSRRDLALLRTDVKAAKEALSEHLTYQLAVPGFAEGFRLTRQEFMALIGAKVEDAVAEMRQTIAAADTQPASLSGMYLAGGSSRIPVVAERLAVGLGVQPQLRDDPKAVVALGALAAILTGAGTRGPGADGPRRATAPPPPACPWPRREAPNLKGPSANESVQHVSTADLSREFLRRARIAAERMARAAGAAFARMVRSAHAEFTRLARSARIGAARTASRSRPFLERASREAEQSWSRARSPKRRKDQ